MIKLFALLMFLMPFTSSAQDELNKETYDLADQFGYRTSGMRLEFLRARARTPAVAIRSEIAEDLSSGDSVRFAMRLDKTVEAILAKTGQALKAKGHTAEADAIASEYSQKWAGFLTAKVLLKTGDLGDYAPFSQFLADVHERAHNLLGDFACQGLHVHDLMILTYGIPVVFSPSEYDLETYQNHFTGVHVAGPIWEHFGLAPVVVYWAVNISCAAGTYGMGIVTFVCGPVSAVSEQLFGVYVSPKIGDKIWSRAQ